MIEGYCHLLEYFTSYFQIHLTGGLIPTQRAPQIWLPILLDPTNSVIRFSSGIKFSYQELTSFLEVMLGYL